MLELNYHVHDHDLEHHHTNNDQQPLQFKQQPLQKQSLLHRLPNLPCRHDLIWTTTGTTSSTRSPSCPRSGAASQKTCRGRHTSHRSGSGADATARPRTRHMSTDGSSYLLKLQEPALLPLRRRRSSSASGVTATGVDIELARRRANHPVASMQAPAAMMSSAGSSARDADSAAGPGPRTRAC